MTMNPLRLIDNDNGEITVSLAGNEVRGWSYASEDERRVKMLLAREYIEGWCDGRDDNATEAVTATAKVRDDLLG